MDAMLKYKNNKNNKQKTKLQLISSGIAQKSQLHRLISIGVPN